MVVCFQTLSFSKIDNHVFFQNLTAELFLYESPDDSYFPKSGGSTFLKTVGSHFSEICGNKITAYICIMDITYFLLTLMHI